VFELNDDQRLVARTVREFVDRDVIPVASDMEHRDEYPDALVETMKTLGLFGLNVPEEHGGHAVAAQQGSVLVTAFHPELTGDRRLHRRFAEMVERARGAVAA